MGKSTKVRLCCPKYNMSEDFEITHAERLLMMPNNGGWELPKDSTFEFTKENGIRHKRDKKADNRAEESQVINRALFHQSRKDSTHKLR